MKYDLKYFILRTNALVIYREAIKFTYKIPDINSRHEMIQFIRSEYEANRNLQDQKRIEYVLGTARKRLNHYKETFYLST